MLRDIAVQYAQLCVIKYNCYKQTYLVLWYGSVLVLFQVIDHVNPICTKTVRP